METEFFNTLVVEAVRVRDAVVFAGGMATKSFMEDFLMLKHSGLSRHDAHTVTNHIEYENKKLSHSSNSTLQEYPEVILQGKKLKKAVVFSG